MNIDLWIILSYLVLTLFVGFYYGRGVKSVKEYAIGDRNFSTTTIVMTFAAT
jgi:Na+/proline symporter